MPRRQVICTKWGRKFGPHDVNRLHRMVTRFLPPPFDFYCVTDHPEGIDDGVEILPIPDVPVVGHRNDHGWRKLSLFAPSLGGPRDGPVLYLDLDVAIVDSLEPFFEIDGEFRIIRDYRPLRVRHHYTGNSSVFRYVAGAHHDLYASLESLGERVFSDYRNEQEFLTHFALKKGILEYWPRPWAVSYKHDCVYPLPVGLFRAPRIPPGAKVLVFHGRPKPEEAVLGVGSKWYRVIRPAPWLREYVD